MWQLEAIQRAIEGLHRRALTLRLLDEVYGGLYRSLDPGFYALSLVRFVLCFLVLLVPTTLMGGTSNLLYLYSKDARQVYYYDEIRADPAR